jgi:hypothetical protein
MSITDKESLDNYESRLENFANVREGASKYYNGTCRVPLQVPSGSKLVPMKINKETRRYLGLFDS